MNESESESESELERDRIYSGPPFLADERLAEIFKTGQAMCRHGIIVDADASHHSCSWRKP